MGNVANMGAGEVVIADGAQIHPTARFNVSEFLSIGYDAKIGEGCEIKGRDIHIGNELYMGAGAKIGGGSCFERQSSLRAGHFLHIGEDSFVNTARAVTIGDEVGLEARGEQGSTSSTAPHPRNHRSPRTRPGVHGYRLRKPHPHPNG